MSGARRSPIIQLDMQAVAQQLAAAKRGGAGADGGGDSSGGAPRRVRPRPPEALLRCCSFCRFCWTCTAGACCSMVRACRACACGHACSRQRAASLHPDPRRPSTQAPPALAAAELLAVLLVYLLAVPNAWPTRVAHLHYSFCRSAEDVVLLSLLRCAAVLLAHAAGAGPRLQRPYLLTALALAAASLPLGLMKLAELARHSGWPRRQWPPFVALYCLHMGFAVAHVVAAQRIAEWVRQRWEHGLGGYGYPWQQGEAAWLLAGQLQSRAEEGGGGDGRDGGDWAGGEDDVPAEQLADADSRWAQCGGLKVHYKLALPLVRRRLLYGRGAALSAVLNWAMRPHEPWRLALPAL